MSPVSAGGEVFTAIAMILLGLFAVGVVITVLVLGIGLIFRLIARLFACVFGVIGDVVGAAVNLLVAPINLARAVVLLVFARFPKADLAARSFHNNLVSCGLRLWSAAVQRPLRVLGIEVPPDRRRQPAFAPAMAAPGGAFPGAPQQVMADRPAPPPPPPPPVPNGAGDASRSPWPDPLSLVTGFAGYTIDGRLPTGGSGAKLYIATPERAKRASLKGMPERVVIKSFAIGEGSTLPQIVRESRSLDAARSLGLVLDHAFEPHRFWYAMPHYEGPSLGHFATVKHRGVAAEAALPAEAQRELVSLMADVVESLSRFHRAGLWHKDIKPDNIIVSRGRAQVIDVGLVTPLASSFTLTTHGTEYFRDPEMVRQALRGTKVNEVDGARFDIYSAGAVLYSVLENTFPAHGGLSAFTKPSPEALRWIVRRAMADYSKRYPSAEAMLADLKYLLAAGDLSAVRPAALPSMRGESARSEGSERFAGFAAGAAAGAAVQPDFAEAARMTAREAMAAARAASHEAMAAARAASQEAVASLRSAQWRRSWTVCRTKRSGRASESAARAKHSGWSPWATAAVTVAAIVIFGTKIGRTKGDGAPVKNGVTFIQGVEGSERSSGRRVTVRPNARSARAPEAVADSMTAALPRGDGKLLVDRAAILAGPLPEALEAQAIAGIGSKGWSPVIGDVEALAAIERLRGSSPEVIRAELERRGYAGLVRLENRGNGVLVTPVALPAK
ncbi:MAG: hypothetical protein KF724_02495 [Phycisphaeraceae bacterium]|nr:hypothetical protein [Phycisphaeraceae bacterium]